MTNTVTDAKRKERVFQRLQALEKGTLTIPQYRAQMKDDGFEEWEIDLYLDGDTDFSEDELTP